MFWFDYIIELKAEKECQTNVFFGAVNLSSCNDCVTILRSDILYTSQTSDFLYFIKSNNRYLTTFSLI